MNEASQQNKKAWEYDAYNFWVKHSGTPEERAAQVLANPVAMLRRYADYFDRYEGIRIANICGSCGKKAVPRHCWERRLPYSIYPSKTEGTPWKSPPRRRYL